VGTLLTLLLITLYFLFLGASPPIARAWVTAATVLIGRLFGMKTSGLNLLGFSLGALILADPLVITNLGFQLTFLCTLAILLFYPALSRLMTCLIPKRPLNTVMEMSRVDRVGFLLASGCRETLALNLAVHLTTLPLLLFLFHRFPLSSLLYNLFFPFLTAGAFLLIIGALGLGPWLGKPLYYLGGNLAKGLLVLATYPPALLDGIIRVKTFPFELVILSVTGLYFLGAAFWESEYRHQN
jgi:competence protein ComEC